MKVNIGKAILPTIDAMQLAIRYGFYFGIVMLLNLEDPSSCNYVNVVWTRCDANVIGSKVVLKKVDHQDAQKIQQLNFVIRLEIRMLSKFSYLVVKKKMIGNIKKTFLIQFITFSIFCGS